jgi:site-specific DNA-methyltransferase (adenine-specific)
MKPYFETENGQLFHGNCREILPHIGPVDLVITSPQYNINNTTGGGFPKAKAKTWNNAALRNGYDSTADDLPHNEYIKQQHEYLKIIWSRLSDNGAIFYNHKPRVQNRILVMPLELIPDLPLRQIIIWKRQGGVNFSPTHYLPVHEWIMVIAKRDFRLTDTGSRKTDVWSFPQARDNEHPAPFPLGLPLNILESAPANLVLDPFMGSGTTAIACERLGKKWVGVEISEKYCEMAAKKIGTETKQLKLFAK